MAVQTLNVGDVPRDMEELDQQAMFSTSISIGHLKDCQLHGKTAKLVAFGSHLISWQMTQSAMSFCPMTSRSVKEKLPSKVFQDAMIPMHAIIPLQTFAAMLVSTP